MKRIHFWITFLAAVAMWYILLYALCARAAEARPLATRCTAQRFLRSHKKFCASVAPQMLAVADYNNGRVVIYQAPFTTNMAATTVLGAPDDHTQGATCADLTANGQQNDMSCVGPVEFIGSQLVAADEGWSRWLVFDFPLVTHMDAALEEGQPWPAPGFGGTFLTNQNGGALNQQSHGGSVSRSPITGAMAGTDSNGSRVLIFKPFTQSGQSAITVLGHFIPPLPNGLPACIPTVNHGDYNASGQHPCPTDATTILYPGELTFDRQGNLWVSDGGDNRVLKFCADASGNFQDGQAACLVIGQSNYTDQGYGLGPDHFTAPGDVKFDSAGNLWVADFEGGRMLRFAPPFTTGMAADMVIGQAGFDSTTGYLAGGFVEHPDCALTGGTTQSTLCDPIQITFDLEGNLYVADFDNNRALEYRAPLASGMPAAVVFGQPDFTSEAPRFPTQPAVTPSSLWQPAGISVYPTSDQP